jgi:hypothetical protein
MSDRPIKNIGPNPGTVEERRDASEVAIKRERRGRQPRASGVPANFTEVTRPTTVKAAGPFGGNSQSGRTAKHGTQSGYVMHRRHRAQCDRMACTCDREACQSCKDAHAVYVRPDLTEAEIMGGYLDGCTCRAIRGAHAASCQWA